MGIISDTAPHALPLMPNAYLVSSFTRCPSSGRISFSIDSLTAFYRFSGDVLYSSHGESGL